MTFARRSAAGAAARLSVDVEQCLEMVRRLQVGGDYWSAQPDLPGPRYALVRSRWFEEADRYVGGLKGEPSILWWTKTEIRRVPRRQRPVHVISGSCDPWHLLTGAVSVIVDADDELALLAAVAGVPVHCLGEGPFNALGAVRQEPEAIRELLQEQLINSFSYENPFTGDPMAPAEAIALCGFWRQLIDSNRDIAGALGFAFWKRATVAPLFWSGSGEVRFLSRPEPLKPGQHLAIWKSRTSPAILADLERANVALVEVEDGFVRSAGLGADCVPPLSITVDRLGAHFDPSQPSELEQLLQEGTFPADLLARARQLREIIVASGLSKYGGGGIPLQRPAGNRRHILVPGQVEDDRSVRSGGGAVQTNLELLKRARQDAPDAYILYKPHPDVEAGHRIGAIPDPLCMTLADQVVREQPISPLIGMVDALHVNTSLAGFEALLRGKPVTTHGVPFYAGWGLTRDLGPVPGRRTTQRSLDELVAAVLLLYPRYMDPKTGLPCPPEILIRRLTEAGARQPDGLVIRLRRLQGRLRLRLRSMRSAP